MKKFILALVLPALAHAQTVDSITSNGTITYQGEPISAVVEVEWAASLTESGRMEWRHLTNIVVTTSPMTNDIPMFFRVRRTDMVYVPGGSFVMGWPAVDGSVESPIPLHNVTLRPFLIAKHETPYSLWHEVRVWAGNNGYAFANLGREGHDGVVGATPTAGNTEPVTQINFRDAIVWCNARSEKEGFNPVYHTPAGAVIRDGRDTNGAVVDAAVFIQSADGYRLPTEAEWEYAARYQDGTNVTPGNYASGSSVPYSDASATGAVAWYVANSGNRTNPVGSKNPTQLGLYDMNGNVWEWLWDWMGNYSAADQDNPTGATSGVNKCLRGGGWSNIANVMQTSYRDRNVPSFESDKFGLRCVRNAR